MRVACSTNQHILPATKALVALLLENCVTSLDSNVDKTRNMWLTRETVSCKNNVFLASHVNL